MKPKHKGPHCAGLCEGQAYITRIAELEERLRKKPQATTMFKLGKKAGMERAAEIINIKRPYGYHSTAEAIRKEIDK